MERLRRALLLGTQEIGSLGVIRSLGKKGVPITTIDREKAPYGISRYVEEAYLIEENLLSLLIELANREEEKPILFLTSREGLPFVIKNMEILKKHYALPLTAKALSYFGPENKWREKLQNQDFNLPLSLYGRRDDILRRVPSETGLPVLIQGEGFGYQVIFTKERDRQRMEAIFKPEENIRAQSVILGPEHNSILQDLFLNASSELVASSAYEVLRRYPKYHGIVTYGREREIADLPNLLPFLREIGYTGPLHVEYKIDEFSKKTYIVNMTPTFSGLTEPLLRRGMDFPLYYYQMASGEEVRERRIWTNHGRPFKRGLLDKYAIASYLSTQSKSWLQILREWRVPYTPLTFAFDDPGPALGELSAYLQGKGKEQVEILRRESKRQR